MLEVESLDAYYGRAHILHGVSLRIARGETLVLLGRNGAGKSTTLKSIIGLVRPAHGRILLHGTDLAGQEPYRIARAGIGYVPEERRIFPDLTVRENLEIGRRPPRTLPPWTPARLFALFPNLGEMQHRPGARMSGGEQQMLAIGRTLMGNPDLILLDEPAEGLAPVIVQQMAAALLALKQEGITILLSEQDPTLARRLADHAAILETGRITWQGPFANRPTQELA